MSSPLALESYEIDVQALMRGLVHELRNPLSAVLTACSLVQGDPNTDEETAMLLDVIQKESRRMNRILTEFSHFAKPPTPNLETFDLGTMACSVVGGLKKEGAFKNVEISEELDETLLVTGDPLHTEGALHHILENAAQALKDGGFLHLWAEKLDGHGCLLIEDSGGAVSDEVLHHAFQPFFSTKPASTGLGLPIARMALRAASGDAAIEAGANGARLRVCLPLAASSAARQTHKAAAHS